MTHELSSEARRYLPLVKSIVSHLQEDLNSAFDADRLTQLGEKGLSDALNQFRTRQGLTVRTYLTYRIRLAILDGLRDYEWSDEDRRRQYLFQKKSCELMLHFHLSAEGSVKRSTKAEEEEIYYLLKILAVAALLLSSNLSRITAALERTQQEFIDLYYTRDQSITAVAKKLRISIAAANRLHIKILETVAANPPRTI